MMYKTDWSVSHTQKLLRGYLVGCKIFDKPSFKFGTKPLFENNYIIITNRMTIAGFVDLSTFLNGILKHHIVHGNLSRRDLVIVKALMQ